MDSLVWGIPAGCFAAMFSAAPLWFVNLLFASLALNVRNLALYWGFVCGLLAAMVLAPLSGFEVSIRLTIDFLLLAVPIAMSSDAFIKRLVCCLVMLVVVPTLCDVAVEFFWSLVTGGSVVDLVTIASHPVELLVQSLIRVASSVALNVLLLVMFRHVFDNGARRDGRFALLGIHGASDLDNLNNNQPRNGYTAALFVPGLLFLAVQTLVVLLLLTAAIWVCDSDSNMLACATVMVLVCLVADGVLLSLLARARAAEREEMRAALLQSRLDAYLNDYQATFELVQKSARLRHDLRNQVQIVNELAARGEFIEAQNHLQAMMDEVGQDS